MYGYIINEDTKRLAVFPNGKPSSSIYDKLNVQDYEVEQDWRGDYYIKGYALSQTENERLHEEYTKELYEKEQWLRDHDYVGVKIATGRATVEEYANVIAQMTEYAARVEELRTLIASLESE